MSTDVDSVRGELAEGFEALAAEEMANRKPVLKAKGGVARTLKTIETNETVTHGQLLQGLLKQAKIAIEVQDGKRPKFVLCERCNRQVPVRPAGHIPKWCKVCKSCRICGKELCLPGKTGLCQGCNSAELTPAQRQERTRKARSALTPDQMKENMRKARAALTPDQMKENMRKARAALTPDQRRDNARCAAAAREAKRCKGPR